MALSRPSRMHRLVHMLESAWNITEPVQLMVHVEPTQRAGLHEDHQAHADGVPGQGRRRVVSPASVIHNKRLNAVVAALPTNSGLIAGD